MRDFSDNTWAPLSEVLNALSVGSLESRRKGHYLKLAGEQNERLKSSCAGECQLDLRKASESSFGTFCGSVKLD
ncbi:hypothetical protein TNCV_3849011 [Trichonephila clavipes]|uniref:Uncharacterized protein n=1 Tax=Trichonephila clavipes TaxID=2585209 RepID=A0A8X6R8F4_TRICX|nr:hypothetical protein TNCV_3849011 [Trichonephila clavipes]